MSFRMVRLLTPVARARSMSRRGRWRSMARTFTRRSGPVGVFSRHGMAEGFHLNTMTLYTPLNGSQVAA